MIDLLKRYFERRGDVALAFLFGSSARGLDGRDSDVDIAIYLTEELSTFARLRNILAHEYLEVTYGSIKKFIDVSPVIYRKIFDFLSQYLKEGGEEDD